MRVVSAAEIDAVLTFPDLIDALKRAFASDIVVPVRHHHAIERDGMATATHLLMPAWTKAASGNYLGAKIVNVFPDNGKRGLPSIYGTYLLMSGETGETLAAMDGTRLTAWRTAAASALAASFLARVDSSRLVMVGAGALAPMIIRAHASIRPIRHVTLWNHNRARAETLAASLANDGLTIEVVGSLEAAMCEADIVSTATLSSQPLVKGAWLKPGAHLDLVGAYTPAMRESDDDCVRRARIFVDTKGGALKEGGDIVQPLADGVIAKTDVVGDLFDLCRGTLRVDREPNDITLFKSVGTAIEDLACAMLVWQRLGSRG
jgi:ornithine cyclodeaminase/alanine dehydrogenase-like protein (mu-crystallin family)